MPGKETCMENRPDIISAFRSTGVPSWLQGLVWVALTAMSLFKLCEPDPLGLSIFTYITVLCPRDVAGSVDLCIAFHYSISFSLHLYSQLWGLRSWGDIFATRSIIAFNGSLSIRCSNTRSSYHWYHVSMSPRPMIVTSFSVLVY